MNDAEPAQCRPVTINYTNLDQQMESAAAEINDNGMFVVDMGQLREYNTAVVCFMVSMLRVCRQRGCRVKVENISSKLRKLLKLYHLNAWFA